MAKAKTKEYTLRSCQWWRAKEEGKEPHQMLAPLLKEVQKSARHRYEAYKHWARCLDEDMSAVDGTEMSYMKLYGSELTLNEALNTLETLHAQVFKNKVLPSPCPVEGDYEEEFQARAFGRWLEGVFDDAKVFEEILPQAGWDTIWAGTGLIKAYGRPGPKKRGKVCFEAVSPRMVFVDRQEAKSGKPRSIHQKMFWDRWVAADRWATDNQELHAKIIEAKAVDIQDADYDLTEGGDGDQIVLWESWHLPSGPGTSDGQHVIWMNNATLFSEPWDHDRFPFTVLRFGQKTAGFWGKSAFARIQPAQKAFDRITRQIDECHQVLGRPNLITRKGSGLNVSHIDDVPFTILETETPATDVKEWNPVPINPAMYSERDSLSRRMKECIGVSQFEAQNQIPTNIRDGAAAYMDRAVEQGQARHSLLHRQLESAMVDLADLALLVANDLLDAGFEVIAKAPGSMRTTIELLSFKSVRMSRDRLKLRVIPVSQLPRTFSNRIKDLAVLRDRGDITQKTFLRLLEIPDIDAEVDSIVSSEDIIKRNISFMLRTGTYTSPLPYDDLDSIVRITLEKVHEARCREVDESKVALLLKYIEDAVDLKKGVGPQQTQVPPEQGLPPDGSMPGQPPPGMPVPPPPIQ